MEGRRGGCGGAVEGLWRGCGGVVEGRGALNPMRLTLSTWYYLLALRATNYD